MYTSSQTVGALIRRLRIERDLTQGQLATYAGVKRDWLSKVEQDKRKRPEREMLERVEAVLRVPTGTLLAAAGYRVTPLPTREPTIEQLLLEALARARTQPIMVNVVEQRAGADAILGGAEVVAERIPYFPSNEAERTHEFIAVEVSGECLAPYVLAGHTVIVDKTEVARPGDIVLALHDNAALIKLLVEEQGRRFLKALVPPSLIPVNDRTYIVGVVKLATYRPRIPRSA